MATLAKIYVASCLVVLGFFIILRLPWGLLPFSDGMNIALVGAALVAFASYYTFYFYRREGFELGWFLANRFGFWILGAAILGLLMIIIGTAVYVAPEFYVPAIEQGALPFGITIVSLFWLALIYLFGYLAVGLVASVVEKLRFRMFVEALTNSLIAFVCIGLTGIFFSLFLEVLNDILLRISAENQWTAIWIFVGGLVAVGIAHGIRKESTDVEEEDD